MTPDNAVVANGEYQKVRNNTDGEEELEDSL